MSAARTVVVTGGLGFLGAHLGRRLAAEGHAVRLLARDSPAARAAEVPQGCEVVWADVQPMVDGTVHDTETYPLQGKPTIFNGYRLAGGHFVWGLTYRMLKGFFAAVHTDWRPPPEL